MPLKYLSNFRRTIEMTLVNCEINLIINWQANFVVSDGSRETTFAIAYIKLYIPADTLSTQDNTKLL